jgi:hypothetical protein
MMRSLILFAVALTGLPVIKAAVPTIAGFNLTWSDDFEGTSNTLPDSSRWIVTTGTSYPGGAANWGTGEIETYTSSTSNLAIDGNSSLVITAIKSASGQWTSGKVETVRQDFMAKPGGKMRIQARLNLPYVGDNSLGYWPAFWTLGASFRGNFTYVTPASHVLPRLTSSSVTGLPVASLISWKISTEVIQSLVRFTAEFLLEGLATRPTEYPII